MPLNEPEFTSRAGSEALLAIGTSLFVLLVIGLFLTAPRLCAWAAPSGAHWQPRTLGQTLGEIRRRQGRMYWQRVGEFTALFVLAQMLGLAIAEIAPYVSDNPEHLSNPSAPRWTIHYANYVLQAGVLYLGICFAAAWYGVRLRQLSERTSPPA